MNAPGSGPLPPATSSPPKKSVPLVPIILSVTALLGVLAILGGVRAFQAMQENSSEAITVGNSLVDNMGQHNYQAARSLFTPQVQTSTSADALKDVETLTEKHHGSFISHGQPQWFVQNMNGQTSVRLTYPAQFTQSDSTVSLILVKTGDGYQVYEAHYTF